MDFGNYRDSVELLDEKTKVSWTSRVCLSPFVRYVLPSFALSLVLLFGLYLGVLLGWLPEDDEFASRQSTCHLRPSYHVSCAPGRQISLQECLNRRCCWREDLKLCYHAFPSRYGYRLDYMSNEGDSREGRITALVKKSPSGNTVRQHLDFSIHKVNDNRVRIALKTTGKTAGKRSDWSNSRIFPSNGMNFSKLSDFGRLFDFLPPNDRARVAKISLGSDSTISVLVHQEPQFSITLARPSGESPLLSTARGPLIVTDNYWEWTLYLTNASLYGLGTALELNGTNNWIYNNENGTARPAFLGIDPQGNAVSCYVDYHGPLEVQVLNESNLVILRGLSFPSELGIELTSGPTPLNAVQQLAGAEHRRLHSLNPKLLGLQLCPDLKNLPEQTSSGIGSPLKSLQESLSSMGSIGAPWDSHCLYRELGLALEHGTSCGGVAQAEVSQARELLLAEGKSFAGHLTPMLFNKAGELRDALEKNSCLLRVANVSYVGQYGNLSCEGVVYPDWTSSKTHELATTGLSRYLSELKPDLVVLRDSWPKDETKKLRGVLEDRFDYLPEGLRQLMSRRTLPFDLMTAESEPHYAGHNAYAERFAEFVYSSSAAAPLVELRGHEGNAGVAANRWPALADAVQAGVVASMLGRMPSAIYVCGADGEYHSFSDELCVRWYGASVAWPRIIVNSEKSPGGKGLSRTGAKQAAKLLRLRASLATYQHTVLAKYVTEGDPILSATSIYYPNEEQPRNTTQNQFMWGDSILVGLVLLPRRSQISMWLPGNLSWRHLQGGSPIAATGNTSVAVTVSNGQIVTLVRPGRIVPVHEEGKTHWSSTSEAMLSSLTLLANVACLDGECQADGSLYYGQDGSSGEFLLIRLREALLTLSNARKVRKLACGATPTRRQATLLEAVQLLGNLTYTINQDLCNSGDEDVVRVDLSEMQPDVSRRAFSVD